MEHNGRPCGFSFGRNHFERDGESALMSPLCPASQVLFLTAHPMMAFPNDPIRERRLAVHFLYMYLSARVRLIQVEVLKWV